MLPNIQYGQAMPIRAWIPVESLDDDLLTLESAAVLALMAKHRTSELSIAIKKWQLIEASLGGKIPESTPIEGAVIALRTLLESTGLALPSTLKETREASFEAALTEMSGLVQGPLRGRNRPQAAVALLNLACEESLVRTEGFPRLLQSKLLSRAWKQIYFFASSIKPKPISPPPPKLRRPIPAEWKSHDPVLVGDSTPWSLGVGPMFHTLAGWDSTWLMGKGAMKDEQWNAISYWTPLPHLALGPLGWSDPAVGSARWILMGMPKETPELSLLSSVWGSDALMYFSHPQMDWVTHDSLGFELRTSGRQISRIYEELGNAKVFTDCGSLHMQVHLQWQLGVGNNEPAGDSRLYSSTEGSRPRFVLELEKMAGWHAQLYAAGDKLSAESSGTELELMVVAPPVGPLGTFKRSRVTGLWHSGSHEAHLLGHSNLNGPLRRVPSTAGVPATSQSLAITPSVRHTSAVAFWLASELARRHPHYVVRSDGPERLILESAAGPTIHISRHAAVSVGGRELVGTSELFAAEDKRGLIGEVEQRIGLPARSQAAPTTERTIVYRSMAHIAALVVAEKAAWDFVPVDNGNSGGAWQLTRDGDSLAFLAPDGNVRVSGKTVNLLERYHFHSHRMTPMIGEVFGGVLP